LPSDCQIIPIMSKLYSIANTANANRTGDVVFLHGVNGDYRKTWTDDQTNAFLPELLGKDQPDIGIWSLDYEASPSRWFGGSTMPLTDRATNVLHQLEVNDIGTKPVIFITHSMGGLVVKWTLRHARDYGNPNWTQIIDSTRGIVFFGTPHSGANLAEWAHGLGTILRVNANVAELTAHNPGLLDLNQWYRNFAISHQIATQVYFETQNTFTLRLVNSTTADPGIPGVVPIPVDADHFSLCKIASPDDLRYKGIVRFIQKNLAAPNPNSPLPGSVLPMKGLWNLPRGADNFAGRKDVLEQLHFQLTGKNAPDETLTERRGLAPGTPQAITGLGGMGKTSLAIRYAETYKREFGTILWFNAGTTTALDRDFQRFADAVGIPTNNLSDTNNVREAVCDFLQNGERWQGEHPYLLIFDNVDDVETVLPYQPQRPCGTLLFTSRLSDLRKLGVRSPISLDVWSEQEALDFFAQATGRDLNAGGEQEAAVLLAKELGCLPLALEQAAAYIDGEHTRCSFSEYHTEFAKRRLELLERQEPNIYHSSLTVATTWNINFRQIEGTPAAELMKYAAFLTPDSIPITLFLHQAKEFPALLSNALQAVGDNRLRLNELLRPAANLSLLRHDAHRHHDGIEAVILSIHRLVQEVTLIALGEQRVEYAECILTAADNDYRDTAARNDFGQIGQSHELLLTAVEKCRQYEAWCGVLVEILSKEGEGNESVRRWYDAQEFHEKALDAVRHLDWLLWVEDYLIMLARIHCIIGTYNEAIPLYQEALEIYRQDDEDGSKTWQGACLSALGAIYRAQANYWQAETTLKEAFDLLENSSVPDVPATFRALLELAETHFALNRMDEAEAECHRTLNFFAENEAYFPDPLGKADCGHLLARIFLRRGDEEQAEAFFQATLNIQRENMLAGQWQMQVVLNNLARLCKSQGRDEEAEELYREALPGAFFFRQQTYHDIAISRDNMAGVYVATGDIEDAKGLMEQAIEVRREYLPPNHPDIARSICDLAELHQQQGHLRKARSLYQEAVEMFTKTLGAEHPQTQDAAKRWNAVPRRFLR
jgi:tetratricopeptide (TPR) repeat protein/pimeloyl-ACP methyl ester carboxylesterase